MAEQGRPTDLTDELTSKIRRGVLAGKMNKEIQAELGINESTWDQWFYKDYNGFRTSVEGWRRDRKLAKAEKILEDIIDKGADDKDILKVVQDTAKFVAETLGKQSYSKRTEQTGADGKDLQVNIVSYADTVQLQSEGISDSSSEVD